MGHNQTLLLSLMIRLGFPQPSPTTEEARKILGEAQYAFVVKLGTMELENLVSLLARDHDDEAERERVAGCLLGAFYAARPELLPCDVHPGRDEDRIDITG